jgi:hypothetical protein
MFIPLFDGAMIVFPSFIGVLTEKLSAKKHKKALILAHNRLSDS